MFLLKDQAIWQTVCQCNNVAMLQTYIIILRKENKTNCHIRPCFKWLSANYSDFALTISFKNDTVG
jgi:hypothetical protein